MLVPTGRRGIGRVLLRSIPDDSGLIEELYLTVLSRPPTDSERKLGRQDLTESVDRRAGAEDLVWALITSQEFVFNH